MTDQNNTPVLPEGTSQIETVPQFAFLMGNWFEFNHKQLSQMLNAPEGQSITVQLEEGAESEDLALTGDLMKGFKAGLIVAMNIFGELPFGNIPAQPEVGESQAPNLQLVASNVEPATPATEAPVNETPVATEAELQEALANKPDDAAPSGS